MCKQKRPFGAVINSLGSNPDCHLLAMGSLAVIYFCISKCTHLIKWRTWNLPAIITARIKQVNTYRALNNKCLAGSTT